MDFLGGALPNVMFIVGMLAIGLGLGIELKLVPLNKEIDKTGRVGAMIVGAILVAASLYIYLNPSLAKPNQPAATQANAVAAPVVAAPTSNVQAATVAPTALSAAIPTAADPPTETVLPSAAPAATALPTVSSTPVPTSTPLPTAVPPTEVPRVTIPDLHEKSEKEAREMLKKAGLQGRKVDECSGPDQGDPKGKKNQVRCQNPAANEAVPLGTTVEYVLR